MKVSANIGLVWQIAGQEAISGRFKEIEPDHFCLALLKFAELSVEEVEKVVNGAIVARELAVEVNAVKEELDSRSVDTKAKRRELRKRIGKGDNEYDGGLMHRSQSSRELFDAASKHGDDAGADTLIARHLIEALFASPTSAMIAVLGESLNRQRVRPAKIPILDEYGRDLTAKAAEGRLVTAPGRSAEIKALYQILSQKKLRSVLLVDESDETTRSVIEGVAHIFGSKKAPAHSEPKRIIDVSGINFSQKEAEASLRKMERVFGAASAAEGIVIFGPAIEETSGSCPAPEWLKLLKSTLTRGGVQCICRIDPSIYQRWVVKDRMWRRLAQVMWIQHKSKEKIPDEL